MRRKIRIIKLPTPQLFTIIILLVIAIACSFLPVSKVNAQEGKPSAVDYFRDTLCPGILGTATAYQRNFCNEYGEKSIGEILSFDIVTSQIGQQLPEGESYDLAAKWAGISGDSSVFDLTIGQIDNINKLLPSSLQAVMCTIRSGRGMEYFRSSWNETNSECKAKVVIEESDEWAQQDAIIKSFKALGNSTSGPKVNLFVVAIQNKCEEITETEECNALRRRYYDHLELIGAPEQPENPTPPIGGDGFTSNLSLKDFEHMSLYAQYLSVVLDSCTKQNSTYCADGLTENQAKRLATIVGLTALGSDPYTGYTYPPLSIFPETHPLYQNILTEPVSNPDSGVMCETVSNLAPILAANTPLSYDTYRICNFASGHSPADGTERLINYCRSSKCIDIDVCQKMIGKTDQRGLLSKYKVQPMFLQTMYWNAADNNVEGRIDNNIKYIHWGKLSKDDLNHIEKVINNPDKGANKTCITETGETEGATAVATPDFACNVEGGLGWALCGTTKFLLESFDWGYKTLNSFMDINTQLVDTKGKNDKTFQVWQAMAKIANILAIIVLLVIIVSQVSGFGISNYNAKKLLPKLIATVILVNLSFFAVRLMVDVSNIAGKSIYDTIIAITDLKNQDLNIINSNAIRASFWNDSLNLILDIITLLILSIIWLVVIIIQVFILGMRDAVLILAIVTAPIVVILYALPNTQRIVSFWAKAISFSLLLYPMMSIIFSLSKAGFLITSNTSGYSFIAKLMSHTILILPMTLSPYAVIKLGTFMPVIGNQAKKALNLGGTIISTGQLPEPKKDSSRYFRAQRKQEAINLANLGAYKGRRYFIQRFKSELINLTGFANSKFANEQTLQSRNAQNSKREQIANSLSMSDADIILAHYAGGASAPKLGSGSNAIAALQASGVSASEMILAASSAKTKNSQRSGTKFDAKSHAKALNLAKQNGASQADLQSAHQQAKDTYKGSNDFSAVGALKGMESHWQSNSDANGDTWGNYNEADWADQNSDINISQHNAIKSDMIHQVLEKPVDEDNNKETLRFNTMSDMGIEVFREEYKNNANFRESIHEQSGSWDALTYREINRAVGGVLPPR